MSARLLGLILTVQYCNKCKRTKTLTGGYKSTVQLQLQTKSESSALFTFTKHLHVTILTAYIPTRR